MLISLLLVSGCAVTAERFDVDRMIGGKEVKVQIVKIDGAGRAKFPDGSEIEKKENFKIPDVITR